MSQEAKTFPFDGYQADLALDGHSATVPERAALAAKMLGVALDRDQDPELNRDGIWFVSLCSEDAETLDEEGYIYRHVDGASINVEMP